MSRSHLIPLLIAGALLAPSTATAADAVVITDNVPEHWRTWQIVGADNANRETRCRFRFDARRVLLGQHVTIGVPKRCMSKADRALKPDPSS